MGYLECRVEYIKGTTPREIQYKFVSTRVSLLKAYVEMLKLKSTDKLFVM
jgi:hypothetical protein